MTTPEDQPADGSAFWSGPFRPVWLEIKDGRLRNYSSDPEVIRWTLDFYEHPVGTARSFGYCGA